MVFTARPNESEESYIWRLGQAKDSGEIDGSWEDIAKLINETYREDETNYYSSSAYRKAYTQAKRFYEAGVFEDLSHEEYVDDIKKAVIRLEQEKVKMRDERNQYNKSIREQARRDYYLDQVKDAVFNAVPDPLEYDANKKFNGVIQSNNDLLISLTDLHAGLEINDFFNTFDGEILKDRLNDYLDQIFEIYVRHSSENAYVVIGEIVSGIIHNLIRIENNMNLIQQFVVVINYIAEFLSELSYRFEEVNVFVTPGNHSRLTPKKDDSLRGENIDFLIIPYLSAKLQNFKNINFYTNNIDEYTALFSIRGKTIAATHGDKDDIKNIVQNITMYFSVKPDIVLVGHRHTNAMMTVYDTKILQAGCMSGSGDNYTKNLRLRNKPEQIVAVIDERGLSCVYDVKFD